MRVEHHEWLNEVDTDAETSFNRSLEDLSEGVKKAIRIFGNGFLRHPANQELKQSLREGELDGQDYFRQLVRLVYRLLFVFITEDRGLLQLPPGGNRDSDDQLNQARRPYFDQYSTKQLRRLADHNAGTDLQDLWQMLCTVFEVLNGTIEHPDIALPALGGLPSVREVMPDLVQARISNGDLLAAIRSLAFVDDADKHARRQMAFEDLSGAELGRVYETLLEMQPEIHPGRAEFTLNDAGGGRRKASGTYYTPGNLVNELINSSLEPLVERALADRLNQEEREQAILSLKICDPAMGCGYFLAAATHRLASHLAAVRTGGDEPVATKYNRAVRDVIRHCIYGVDINPDAVELCKIRLWLESTLPGQPLSFLDSHIRCGNSLLGATPELLAGGIPDEAFKAFEGDDREWTTLLRKRNREERTAVIEQYRERIESAEQLSTVLAAMSSIEGMDESTVKAVDTKRRKYIEFLNSADYINSRMLADAWCAAFVWVRRRDAVPAVTQRVFNDLLHNPHSVDAAARGEINRLTVQYRFFHWHLEFPDVFQAGENQTDITGNSPVRGFDLMIGNPPFVNVIEGGIDKRSSNMHAFLKPGIGGTADLAGRFLVFMMDHVNNAGCLGFVQPRASLNTPALKQFRADPGRGFTPSMIYAPDDPHLFAGAAVFVCLLTLAKVQSARIAVGGDPANLTWYNGKVEGDNWWLSVRQIAGDCENIRAGGTPVGELFEVQSSMTAGDAYNVKPYVHDSGDGKDLKLVTTGLIDPHTCLWGQSKCRFLKDDYMHPRIREDAALSDSLKRRLAKSRRPKVIVAGLSSRIESFMDEQGEYIGAVSTFSIYHGQDSIAELIRLNAFLCSEQATAVFRAELGANALGGGNITMKKYFLGKLRIQGS